MRGEAATTGRWLRFVLLACTLFGLAAMHSLGHDPILGTAGHDSHGGAAATPALSGGCHGDQCTQLAAPASEEPGNGHTPGWAVCMAIAAGLALAVVLAVVLLHGTRRERPRGRTSTRASGGRAPPPLTLIDLTTASISVLRI
ncbi:hypothetical protein C1I95_18765 [Micromonospora craterilacus]|uniref:Uncharacterized protein n=1 Tax=Micromonospora craterilacus TaxID=1655439 RepID=A0A2W2F2U0_9ACTN|nr:DUF6153 family protein [Micromonospora craterilacus]PZG15867.1 hypothetical protein C1I95_18765 [Micromonospora craterilacus]